MRKVLVEAAEASAKTIADIARINNAIHKFKNMISDEAMPDAPPL
jgi:hypothetical protein